MREELELLRENLGNWELGRNWEHWEGNWEGTGMDWEGTGMDWEGTGMDWEGTGMDWEHWDGLGWTGREAGGTGLYWEHWSVLGGLVCTGRTGISSPFPARQELRQVRWHQMELGRITDLLCQTINNSNKCPDGWQFHKNTCYLFSEIPQSWGRAQNSCAAFSAHLVVVSTEDEQLFLVHNIQRNNSYWIGVMDEQHKGQWTWITGETPSFGFWDVWSEDPDKEYKDCGAMKSNGRWIGERCSEFNRWICEKSWDCNSSLLPPLPEKSAPAL
uniref:C-type lectin domain-containing protein n=1 Tax=Cyanistes caeruleus TaxID=156563 RepID=A0A8C0UMK3_CYACU